MGALAAVAVMAGAERARTQERTVERPKDRKRNAQESLKERHGA